MKRAGSFAVLSALVFILSVPVLAAEQPPASASPVPPAPQPERLTAQSFQKRKEAILGRLDKRISSLQELRSCVASANSREDMKKCREKFKEERQEDKRMGGK